MLSKLIWFFVQLCIMFSINNACKQKKKKEYFKRQVGVVRMTIRLRENETKEKREIYININI